MELETAKNSIYKGKKDDAVDMELSRFLNSYPEKEKMKILFLRESEGVYRFGQRRVYIRVEKGNQILVRIGGGYMNIKDFIEEFT